MNSCLVNEKITVKDKFNIKILPRGAHTATIIGNKMYIFAGLRNKTGEEDFVYLNDLLVYDLIADTMTLPTVSGDVPQARAGHCSTHIGKNIYVFGGRNGSLLLEDVMMYSTERQTWKKISCGGKVPKARAGSTMNSIDDNTIILWGGSDWKNYDASIYVFDVTKAYWKEIEAKGTIPEPRFWHSSAIIGYKMYIYGGAYDKTIFNDIYTLDLIPLRLQKDYTSITPNLSFLDEKFSTLNMKTLEIKTSSPITSESHSFDRSTSSGSIDRSPLTRDSLDRSFDKSIENILKIKCVYKDETRIFSFQKDSLTFLVLLEKLNDVYKSIVTVKYVDEEGDVITIRSDDELNEFFDFFNRMNKPYRLDVHVKMIKNDKSTFKWQKGDLLGTGAYGKVYMAINLENGEFMAVKQVPLKGTQEKRRKILSELVNEINLMKQLKHENIVRYLGVESTEDYLNIFLELVPGGSISSLLSKFKMFHESIVRIYTKQILMGLKYLHENEILHRDIKAANILLDDRGTVKLADFGHSKNIKDLEKNKSLKGTPLWMAPEVITDNLYSKQSDVWSLGCTIIEMITGRPPYPELSHLNQMQIMFHIGKDKKPPQIPKDLSSSGKAFLSKCFVQDPKKRANCEDLLTMPFIMTALDPDEEVTLVVSEEISPITDSYNSTYESKRTYVSNESFDDENRVPDTVMDTLRSIDRQIQNIQETNKSVSVRPFTQLQGVAKQDNVLKFIKEKTNVTLQMEKSLTSSINSWVQE